MKIGDIVRLKKLSYEPLHRRQSGVIVSELRQGINRSWVDVLVDGKVIPVDWKILEVVSESG